MKSRFCAVYLYLFGFDAVLGLFGVIATFLGSRLALNFIVRIFFDTFSYALFILSVIQVVLGIIKKFRWSARIIGIYVVFYFIATMIISFFYSIYLIYQGIEPGAELTAYLLLSPLLNIWSAFIGLIQLGLFFWAVKDLSKGHYLAKGLPAQTMR